MSLQAQLDRPQVERPETKSPLASFVAAESAMRQAKDVDALRFVLCNETRQTLGFRQAFILEQRKFTWAVTCVSSVTSFDKDSPLLRNISSIVKSQVQNPGAQTIDISKAAETLGLDNGTYPFRHGLFVPLNNRDETVYAGILFARERQWSEDDYVLAEAIAETGTHAWLALQPERSRFWHRIPLKPVSMIAMIVVAALLFVPVPLTALAPAEVVARQPVVISAPLDGVVGSLPVLPNSVVNEGDIILTFVDTKLRNDAEISTRTRAVSASRVHRAVQASFGSPKDAHDIAIARAELALAEAEETRARELLNRSVVRASRGGILIYSAPEDWIGKPLATGERVMDIVDPASVELRIDLAISDVIALKTGARTTFFPDGDPLDKRSATIKRTGHRATPVAEGILAYRNYSTFDKTEKEGLRIGARGTAKVFGENVPLALYLFRRPLSAIRQQAGL